MNVSYKLILDRFAEKSPEIFNQQLVGIYLHGSAVMNCFNPEKSDIDLLLVVDGDINEKQKSEFLKTVLELNKIAPPKGLELSIVKKEFCKPFVYPTPYEFHFSNGYKDEAENTPIEFIRKIHGTDRDLAAHFMITYHRGQTVYGKEIKDVFECPGRKEYLDSIMYDVENAEEDISTSPMYIILNLCRVLAYVKESLILSKKEGGEWGMSSLPEKYVSTVICALNEYKDSYNTVYDEAALKEYAKYMLGAIKHQLSHTEDQE